MHLVLPPALITPSFPHNKDEKTEEEEETQWNFATKQNPTLFQHLSRAFLVESGGLSLKIVLFLSYYLHPTDHPDWSYHNFRVSRSVDRRILSSSGTTLKQIFERVGQVFIIDGFRNVILARKTGTSYIFYSYHAYNRHVLFQYLMCSNISLLKRSFGHEAS